MQLSDPPLQQQTRGSTRPWGLCALVLASIALHVGVLMLPWPEEQAIEPEAPEPTELDEPPLMDVAVLPDGWLEDTTVAATEEAANSAQPVQTAARDRQQTPASNPSPQPEAEAVPTTQPEPPTEPPPESTDEPDPGAIGELPPEDGRPPPGGPTPPPPKTLDEKLRDRVEYIFSVIGIRGEGDVSSELWSSWKAEGQVFPEKVDPLEVPYLLDGCLDQAPRSGSLALILDADGTPLKGPKMLSSTGYPLLDEKALELVKTHTFPDRTQAKGYSLEVQVQYPDDCPR